MGEKILKEYDAKLDSKHRCIIRGMSPFNRYHVRVFNTGKIEMHPRVLASPEELSENTLRMIYGSVKNLKKGKAGSTVNFSNYKKFLNDGN
jgi:hypothetical protein